MAYAMLALTTACGNDGTGPFAETFSASLSGANVVHELFTVTLDTAAVVAALFTAAADGGRQISNTVVTNATGSATFTVENSVLDYAIDLASIDRVTAAHLHAGGVAATGPVLVGLFSGPTTATGFTGTLVADTVTVADSVLAAMRAGNAYVNVHTVANQLGEIRGQTQLVANNVTGLATFSLVGSVLAYTISVSNIESVTAAHIHAGASGATGPILVRLFSGPTTAAGFAGMLVQDSVTVADSVVTAMRTGGAYVNVHTAENPRGAIRGPIVVSGSQ